MNILQWFLTQKKRKKKKKKEKPSNLEKTKKKNYIVFVKMKSG